jgi:hypothetical protein
MNCQDLQSTLSLYLYGELDFDQEDEVETHLAECAACQLSLAREQQWHASTKALVQEPPLHLLNECRQQLRPALSPDTGRRWGWSFPFEISFTRWSSQVALASLFLFVGFGAARWTDRASGHTSINPTNTFIRDIQTDNSGLVRLFVDQENEVTGHVSDANVRSLLFSGARQQDAAVRFYAMQLLNRDAAAQRSDELRDVLFEAVRSDPNPAIRLEAIDGLRRFSSDPAAFEAVKFVLQHDDNPGVRYQALDMLVPPNQNVRITPAMTQTLVEILRFSPEGDYVHSRCSQILQEAKVSVVY